MKPLNYFRIFAIALMTWTIAFASAMALAKTTRGDVLAGKDNSSSQEVKVAKAGSKGGLPPGVTLNACGCYRHNDACVCTNRNAKCECPGDCEPVGCEAKRKKEIERELAEEEKRIQDEHKRREEEAKERARKAEEAQKHEAVDEYDLVDSIVPPPPSPPDGGVAPGPDKSSKKKRKAPSKKEG